MPRVHPVTAGGPDPDLGTRGTRKFARFLLCGLAGLGVTALVFSALAGTQSHSQEDLPEDIPLVSEVSLPIPPPPPPRRDEEPPATDASALPSIPFQADRNPGGIAIAAAPMEIELIQARAVAPSAKVVTQFGVFDAKPKAALALENPNHVWEKTEVDQPPFALNRVAPAIRSGWVAGMVQTRVNCIFIVETNGRATQMRLVASCGKKEIDKACMEALGQWEFAPAIKKGRRVRCWVQQSLHISTGSSSAFSN